MHLGPVRSRWFLLVPILFLAGCQGRGDLSGKVTYQGKTVYVMSLQALGPEGFPRLASLEDGVFTFKGLPTGEYRFSIASPEPTKSLSALRKPDCLPPAPAVDLAKWFRIPAKYADFNESGLTFTVKRGVNEFNIVLE